MFEQQYFIVWWGVLRMYRLILDDSLHFLTFWFWFFLHLPIHSQFPFLYLEHFASINNCLAFHSFNK